MLLLFVVSNLFYTSFAQGRECQEEDDRYLRLQNNSMIDCKRFIDLMRGSWYSSSRAASSPPLETRITNGGDTDDDRSGFIAAGTCTHFRHSSAEEERDFVLTNC